LTRYKKIANIDKSKLLSTLSFLNIIKERNMRNLTTDNFPIHKRPLVKAILHFENISKFAKSVGATRQTVSGWLYNCKMGVPPRYCKKIEEITLGQITRKQLRPDVYGNSDHSEPSDKEKLSLCISLLNDVSNNLKPSKRKS
jgi:DNA-binding transcriptional regulator YdaS (Cro superfamily)